MAAAADPKYPQHKTKSLINYLNFNERNGEKVRSVLLVVAVEVEFVFFILELTHLTTLVLLSGEGLHDLFGEQKLHQFSLDAFGVDLINPVWRLHRAEVPTEETDLCAAVVALLLSDFIAVINQPLARVLVNQVVVNRLEHLLFMILVHQMDKHFKIIFARHFFNLVDKQLVGELVQLSFHFC